METITLRSSGAEAKVLPQKGGLIAKLYFADSGSILWLPQDFDASTSRWPGGGLPFLFPFAGRVQHRGELYKYALEDKVYPMPLHGFSWSMPWEVLDIKESQTKLQLRSSETSHPIYPFEFTVIMDIVLTPKDLLISIDITNHGALTPLKFEKMPVAVGWHPYFCLGSSSATLDINAKKIFPVTEQGFAGLPVASVDHLGHPPWPLSNSEFNSLIIGDILGQTATLNTANSKIKMTCEPEGVFNYIVTWTNAPKEFQCVEPWMSLPDAVNVPSGCRWLATEERLTARLSISVG